EREALGAATGGPDTLLAVAGVLLHADAPALAAKLARTALLLPAVDAARALRLLYPLDDADVLSREARRRGIDPMFAAALIRQESGFDPEAVSGAGARGMMQVMPSVGAAIARRSHFPMWDPVLLFQPDVNLEIGMAQLQNLLARFQDPVRVLAAYNAGGGKVLSWEQRSGVGDPEVFIERIPFPETRDYVRTVLRNREAYRRLYGW
ncbi:MAG: lytic transglycosylase domain-containing protein, partial [Gemmatimonadales bacterium]